MKSVITGVSKFFVMVLIAVTMVSTTVVPGVSAATMSVRQAQAIAHKFSMPVGAVDGVYGANTGRGFCAFRVMSGLPASRANVEATLSAKLSAYNAKYASLTKIPAPALNGARTYMLAHQTCQAMFFVKNGYYAAALPISTGISTNPTPNGTWTLGSTQRGWSCSTLYPETCYTQNVGRFAYISNKGNLYNKRNVVGAIKVHGSTSVPPRPASHGCIRVTVGHSDWMYDHVPGNIPIRVVGKY